MESTLTFTFSDGMSLFALIFAAGNAWATIRYNRVSIQDAKSQLLELRRNFERASDERAILRGAVRALISTIKDDGERRALEAGFVFRNSPPRLARDKLRELVRERGRPPQYVIDKIRAIAMDRMLQTDEQILGAIHGGFTEAELARAASVHGGSISAANFVFLQSVREAREDGVDFFLHDVGLTD